MMQIQSLRPTSGFTLVEMSIIVVIVGIVAAGIVMGKQILDNAATMSVASDFEKYRSAAVSYRDRYKFLPGDDPHADDTFGAAADCPEPTPTDVPSTDTCGGDADGYVAYNSSITPFGANPNYYEGLLAWQHLSNARLIQGQYSGKRSTASDNATIGINYPLSRISGATFVLRHFLYTGNDAFPAEYGHVLMFGQPAPSGINIGFWGSVLTSQQAYLIDAKIDDGRPGLGSVISIAQSGNQCPTTDEPTTAEYDLATSGKICGLLFLTGF